MLEAIDFTTFYIDSVDPANVAQLAQAGYNHAAIGYDSAPASLVVQQTFMQQGFASWDAYRYLYFNRPVNPQIDDVVAGIHNTPDPLPGFLWIDCEDDPPLNDPKTWIRAAMDRVESYDIKPTGTLVRPGIYSANWWWQKYLAGWTEPADRGWALWLAYWNGNPDPNDPGQLFGGWTRAEAKQYGGGTNLAIGQVDLDVFRDRTAAPAPDPEPVPQPADVEDTRLRKVMAWRLAGATKAVQDLATYLDPANTPPES